jgi:tellurite resistance protein TerC
MTTDTGLWLLFAAIVATVMVIDLGFLHRKAHTISLKEASFWTATWVTLALAFAAVIAFASGRERALQFLAGYLLEESLSADNMFVFLVIFDYFAVPALYQSRVLHLGILGTIVMRFIFIFAGVALISRFHWLIYAFGALLIYTGAKMTLTQIGRAHV